MTGAVVFSTILSIIGNYIFARYQHKGLKSLPFLFTKKRIKELTGYGLFAFLSKAAFKIIGQTDLVLAGLLFSIASVREYSVGGHVNFLFRDVYQYY